MRFSFAGGRKKKYGLLLLLAGLTAAAGSWFFVHLDLERQEIWLARSRGALWPVVHLGEFASGITDSVGIGGRDAVAPLPAESLRSDMFYAGMPRHKGWFSSPDLAVLRNQGFVVGYDEAGRIPAWVAYRVFKIDDFHSPPRPSKFKADTRTYAQVAHGDYSKSGYDRGHLAPNYAIATRYGRAAQLETFLMSNIAPQRPGLNRRAWKDVEMAVARFHGQSCGEVWVVTGPINGKNPQRLPSGVVIPEAFYKIVVDESEKGLRVLPFVFPQEFRHRQWPRRHLVSVDEIEKATGLDFFSKLPDGIEDRLESQIPTRIWAVPIPLQLRHAFKRD